jgi:hypothetical protein
MLVVCPSVKNVGMAAEVLRLALNHVRLVRDVLSAQDVDPYLESEFVRGWDAEELRHPILFEARPRLFIESELFLIHDFSLDGGLRSITPMTREQLYRGV